MEIERTKMLESIGRVLPATARKEVFSQATKIIFTDGQLGAYNDEISIFDRQDALRGLEGAVDGKQLHSLLGKMKAERVSLEAAGSKLNLKAGRVNASFDLAPVALPLDELDKSGDDSEPLAENFVRGLRLIAGTCARDMSRPVLTCIKIEGGNLEAADGFRAAKISLGDVGLPTMLLPVTAAEVLVDYPIERAAVSDGGEWARFSSNKGNTTIFARIFSGKFPDLSSLYEVEGDEVTLPPALGEVLDRAKIFADREHSIDEVVQVSLRPNQVTVSSQYEGGQFREVVRSDQTATADFTIHPDFLSEVLKTGKRCVVGKTRVKFTGPAWQHVIALRD